jgi:hypothetical protein
MIKILFILSCVSVSKTTFAQNSDCPKKLQEHGAKFVASHAYTEKIVIFVADQELIVQVLIDFWKEL